MTVRELVLLLQGSPEYAQVVVPVLVEKGYKYVPVSSAQVIGGKTVVCLNMGVGAIPEEESERTK